MPVLFVDDPLEDRAPGPDEHFAHAFNLTAAEARLAAHLASGASLTEASELLRIRYNTARAQLRAIFDKTDVHRQSELVRMLQSSRSLRLSLE